MPRSIIVPAIVAVILNATVASAAPPDLYGKTIRVEYTVLVTFMGHHGPQDQVSNVRRTIYVSGAGRLFERHEISNRGGTRVSDNSPDASSNASGEARNLSFNGSTLLANIAYSSGAVRLIVHFDPEFSRCDGTINFGTEGGRVMVRRGTQITSIKASNITCSIAAGNPFQ